jgi:hypothetical protein
MIRKDLGRAGVFSYTTGSCWLATGRYKIKRPGLNPGPEVVLQTFTFLERL